MSKKFVRGLGALMAACLMSLTACGGGSASPSDPSAAPAESSTAASTAAAADASQPAESSAAPEGSKAATTADAAGALRIGALFAPTDSLDPATVTSPGGMLLMYYVYDSLFMMTDQGEIKSMADSYESNPTADEWTVKLRDGIKYSDGTPVNGEDVLASIKHLSTTPNYMSMYGNVDFEASKADEKSVTFKLKKPASDFVTSSLAMISPVAPKGEFKGIGAGPYTVKGGDNSTGYTLTANPDYFSGEPSIKEVVLKNIPDPASQTNALKANEIDYAWGLDAASLKVLSSDPSIVFPEPSFDSAPAKELVLNTRVAPFDDPEVRHAAKLTLDRNKMVTTLLGDTGAVGNDMLGMGYSTYPKDIPQTEPNKEEAKKIFAEKGVKSFKMIASDTVPGQVAAAELMVQEFAEVGVTVELETLDPGTFFNQMETLYKTPAFTFYWINRQPMIEFASQAVADSPYNMSGYHSEVIDKNYALAQSTLDKAEQQKAIDAISKDIHDNGGEIIWGYQKQLSAHRKGLEGFQTFQSIPWIPKATFKP